VKTCCYEEVDGKRAGYALHKIDSLVDVETVALKNDNLAFERRYEKHMFHGQDACRRDR
jgi:hypothetical protein